MSSEERDKDLPPEPVPGAGGSSRPMEDAPGPSERPEDRLGDELGERADTVTQELRDLQDEMMPPEPASRPPVEPAAQEPVTGSEPDAEPAAFEPAPVVPPVTEPGLEYSRSGSGANAAPEGTDDDRLMSMLAWLAMVILQLPVVSIIQLLSENTKNRPFQRHHAITSLLFYGASIVYEIVATVVFVILTTVTLGCGAFCLWVIFFVPHALALYYAFQAYGGKRVELPYVSKFARQQGWM